MQGWLWGMLVVNLDSFTHKKSRIMQFSIPYLTDLEFYFAQGGMDELACTQDI